MKTDIFPENIPTDQVQIALLLVDRSRFLQRSVSLAFLDHGSMNTVFRILQRKGEASGDHCPQHILFSNFTAVIISKFQYL